MSDAEPLLPGGRGELQDPLAQDESYDVRRRLDAPKDGWLISTVGENIYSHLDVTGVLATANQLSFFYVPDRTRRVLLRSARINVAAAVASSTYRAALYIYTHIESQRRLLKVPGSEVLFSGAATGLQETRMSRDIELPTEAKCFIAAWSSSAALALEGYQSGAGAAPRVLRRRAISSVTPPFGGSYALSKIPVADAAIDTPLIAYLSPDALEVF